eukprot:c15368_g1_i1 orf=2-280(-)
MLILLLFYSDLAALLQLVSVHAVATTVSMLLLLLCYFDLAALLLLQLLRLPSHFYAAAELSVVAFSDSYYGCRAAHSILVSSKDPIFLVSYGL